MATISLAIKLANVGQLSPRTPDAANALICAATGKLDQLGFTVEGISIVGLFVVVKATFNTSREVTNPQHAEDVVYNALCHDSQLGVDDFVIDENESEFDPTEEDEMTREEIHSKGRWERESEEYFTR
jgi:hypothetical protein